MIEQSIDTSDWKFVLLKNQDNLFEINIVARNIVALDDEIKNNAADLLVKNLLGEKIKINHVSNIQVIDEFSEADKKNSSSVTELNEHIKKSLKS